MKETHECETCRHWSKLSYGDLIRTHYPCKACCHAYADEWEAKENEKN